MVRNSTVLRFCVFLALVFLAFYYVKHSKLYNHIVPRTTTENPVISAMQDTITLEDQKIFDCAQLFGAKSLAHNFSLSEDFNININKFLSAIEANNAKNIGHIYMLKFQFKLYHYLTWKLKFVRTICETGKNNYCTDRMICTCRSFSIAYYYAAISL